MRTLEEKILNETIEELQGSCISGEIEWDTCILAMQRFKEQSIHQNEERVIGINQKQQEPVDSRYCQSSIEGKEKCSKQCEHCAEYYRQLEDEKLWERACNAQLAEIKKAFENSTNYQKASENEKIVFQAIADTITNFPIAPFRKDQKHKDPIDVEKLAERLFDTFSSPLDSGDFGSGVQLYMSQEDFRLALMQFISESNKAQEVYGIIKKEKDGSK